MKENITVLCQKFIENGRVIKKVFPMESSLIYPIASNILSAQGETADEAKLRKCKAIVSRNAGTFSFLNGQRHGCHAICRESLDEGRSYGRI